MAIDIWKSPNSCFWPAWFPPGVTIVCIIPAQHLIRDTTAVKLLFAYDGNDLDYDELWIGHPGPGDEYDFDGNQVQLFVSASANWTVNAQGIWTDEATFALDHTKNILLAAALPYFESIPASACSNSFYRLWYQWGNDAATTDKVGYMGATHFHHITQYQQIIGPSAYHLAGTVKLQGNPVARAVHAYVRSTGEFFSSGVSAGDGTYSIDAPDDTTEMLVVALDDDPGDQYNDLIYGRVKGVAV